MGETPFNAPKTDDLKNAILKNEPKYGKIKKYGITTECVDLIK